MGSSETELARADKVLRGLWRLKLPCVWPGVPHSNAYVLAQGDGIVLVDTGVGGPPGEGHVEYGLKQLGFSMADITQVVCTHNHSDHSGAAKTILAASGSELWMHPAWGHARHLVEDPEGSMRDRAELAVRSGIPREMVEAQLERRKGSPPSSDGIVEPDHDLVPGVEIESDLGTWQVHEAPGHAPSHVVLHQPERRLLLSGDHLLGRISFFFDHGHTPDPLGEFLGSLDRVDQLEIDLCLAGHGRPFRDVPKKIAANRKLADKHLEIVRGELADGPVTPFDTVPAILGDYFNEMTAGWGLELALVYLDHLGLRGEIRKLEDDELDRWEMV